MVPPRARDDNLHPADYYHRGSVSDPGYTDPIRMPMHDSDLYSNTRGSSSNFNQGVSNHGSDGYNQPHGINNPLFNNTASTVPLTSSAILRQPHRLGRNHPIFRGSTVRVQGYYDLQAIRHNRTIGFSATPAPFLEGSRFTSNEVRKLISYIQQLLRADAYDESCMAGLIDDTARDFCLRCNTSFNTQSNKQLNEGLGCCDIHRGFRRGLSTSTWRQTSWPRSKMVGSCVSYSKGSSLQWRHGGTMKFLDRRIDYCSLRHWGNTSAEPAGDPQVCSKMLHVFVEPAQADTIEQRVSKDFGESTRCWPWIQAYSIIEQDIISSHNVDSWVGAWEPTAPAKDCRSIQRIGSHQQAAAIWKWTSLYSENIYSSRRCFFDMWGVWVTRIHGTKLSRQTTPWLKYYWIMDS